MQYEKSCQMIKHETKKEIIKHPKNFIGSFSRAINAFRQIPLSQCNYLADSRTTGTGVKSNAAL
jgi:hypothetical protein